ncbi:MAG: tRNA (N(6)-L-threonylcarbamoyladenosine(37)-C(2))-methylthiotransferase MtaB [Roseburia sp.]|nr:tRNA (N(6)-L-threonylcarbamoyladenosine(37)-C(2))-methylthiotransferase MtaB [Roseburia sp.]
MKKAALHNLGCKVNAYETEAMQHILETAGYEIVPFTEKADVYVINTCSVTNIADRKSRQMLHKAKKNNPDAVVVAAGCYVQTKEAEAALDESIDIIIGNNKKHELVELLEKFEAGKRQNSIVDINHEKQEYEELYLESTAEHTRAFLKVQDGCNQFCSYCIIPFARGRVRSRRAEDVLEEVRRLAEHGYQEVVLTGIHLSSYGVDTGDSLLHLIELVHEVEGIKRIRLGSLEPRIVTEDFVKRLSRLEKICPHFHLSLQSGCDTVLARMNRRYDTAEYEAGCQLLRKYFSHPAITTDVIVGFPGETEEEFQMTREYLERIHFYEMHIFKYSKREGTKAAAMKNQVPEPEKNRRSAILLDLEKKMSEEFRNAYLGKTVTALLEEKMEFEGKTYFTGYTKEYVKVAFEAGGDLTNQFVTGKISEQLTGDIYLMVEF